MTGFPASSTTFTTTESEAAERANEIVPSFAVPESSVTFGLATDSFKSPGETT